MLPPRRPCTLSWTKGGPATRLKLTWSPPSSIRCAALRDVSAKAAGASARLRWTISLSMRTRPLPSSTAAPARFISARAPFPMNSMPIVSSSRSDAWWMASTCPSGRMSMAATVRLIRLRSRLAGSTARVAEPLRPRVGRCSRSMGKEHRQSGVDQNIIGRATEDELPEPAVGIGAFDQEVGTLPLADIEHDLAGSLIAGFRMPRFGRDPGEQQGAAELCPARSLDHAALHGENQHPLRRLEQRHREADGPRCLGAAVPGDDDIVADACRCRRRRHDQRPPGLEQHGFEKLPSRCLVAAPRTRQHRDLEQPRHASNGQVARLDPFDPARSDRACRYRTLVERHAGRPHRPDEARMDVLCARSVLLVEILERDWCHGADPAGTDDNAPEIRPGRNAGDMPARLARQQDRGFELRLQLWGALDRDDD